MNINLNIFPDFAYPPCIYFFPFRKVKNVLLRSFFHNLKKNSYLRKMAPHVGNGSWSFRCCCYSGFVGLNWTPTGNGDRVQLHNGSPGMNPPDQQTLQRMGGHIGVPADPHSRKLTGHLRLPFWGLFFFVYRLKIFQGTQLIRFNIKV